MISFNKVNEILQTLPVGYYLGSKIEVSLEDSDKAYFNPIDYNIVIGYRLLPLYDIDENDEQIENNIRCMLYHEISHVILTPRSLRMTEFMNIFEDQRIETLMKKVYHRVDFENFVKRVNHFMGEKPKDANELYYQIIRYGIGPKEFVERRNQIIKEYSYINKINDFSSYAYFKEVEKLYNDIVNHYESEMSKMSETSDTTETSETSDSGNSTSDTSSEKSVNEIDEKNEASATSSSTGTSETSEASEASETTGTSDSEKEVELTEEEINEITKLVLNAIKNILEFYNDKKLYSQMKMIIDNVNRKKRGMASSINTYSGKLNPKLIGKQVVENYKWWEKPMANGNANRFTKTHLNLFVDVSGSFHSSEKEINIIIKSLSDIEKVNPNFSFTIIKMGDTNRIASKNDRQINCCEGNYLTNDILDIYKKVQLPNQSIINIAVFDGDAQSFDYATNRMALRKKHEQAWSFLNHNNCVLISDYANQYNFDKYSPNAKRIYTYDYTNKLKENVMGALKILLS